VKDFEVYISKTRDAWGDPVHKGRFANNPKKQEIRFTRPQTGRYVQLKVLSSYNSEMNAAIAEWEVITK
jgi:beta-galactosidase